jgi:hypothetical protein
MPVGNPTELSRPLIEYAERLLLGTGLSASDAVLLASARIEAPTELRYLAEALQAGWNLAKDEG